MKKIAVNINGASRTQKNAICALFKFSEAMNAMDTDVQKLGPLFGQLPEEALIELASKLTTGIMAIGRAVR